MKVTMKAKTNLQFHSFELADNCKLNFRQDIEQLIRVSYTEKK